MTTSNVAPDKKPEPQTGLTKIDLGLATFSAWLNRMKPQLGAAVPKHVSVDRMLRLALTTLRKNPDLLECTRDSILGSIVQASHLGLEFDGVLGEAYLIPRNEKQKNGQYLKVCQMQPGYKGLIKLARNTGQLSTIYAKVTHAKDVFDFEYGMNERLIHKPALVNDPGPPAFIYAFARLKDSATQFDVMSVVQVEALRARGGNRGFSPWNTDWDAMACAKVLRRLCKFLPSSVEMQRAVVLDEAIDAGIKQTFDAEVETGTGLLDADPGLTAGGEKVEAQAGTDETPVAAEVEQTGKPLTDLAARARAAREAQAADEDERGDDPLRDERDQKRRERT